MLSVSFLTTPSTIYPPILQLNNKQPRTIIYIKFVSKKITLQWAGRGLLLVILIVFYQRPLSLSLAHCDELSQWQLRANLGTSQGVFPRRDGVYTASLGVMTKYYVARYS